MYAYSDEDSVNKLNDRINSFLDAFKMLTWPERLCTDAVNKAIR